MKKLILALAVVGFIAMTAATKSTSMVINKAVTKTILTDDKYKACIEACNVCIASCKKTEMMCAKMKDSKMDHCMKLCKECVTECTAAIKLMKENSPQAKAKCLECAKVCEKCAAECDKFDMTDCKKCATDCRKCEKACKEM